MQFLWDKQYFMIVLRNKENRVGYDGKGKATEW